MNSLFDTLTDLKNSKVAVVGLGLSGLSTVKYLVRNGILPDIFDSRTSPPNQDQLAQDFPQLHCNFGEFSINQFAQYAYVIVSPGISFATPALAQALKNNDNIFCDVELFARINNKPVVAVTGSNGKSTVVAWLEHSLNLAGKKAVACGNYGVPVLDVIDQDYDVFVLELSSFQLESVNSLQCQSAAVLNVTEDHMDRYDSFDDYSKAKNQIYSHAQLCIYNQDDFQTKPLISHDNVVSFGMLGECCEQTCWQFNPDEGTLKKNQNVLANLEEFNVSGTHNGLNALVVLAMAESLGIQFSDHKSAFTSFAGLPHRCQLVYEQNGVQYIDDSKATNVASTLAALKGLAEDKNIVLIAGGDAKGADLSELSDAIERDVKHLVAIGKDKEQFSEFVPSEQLTLVNDMAQAMAVAKSKAITGDIILLSPACASIDMFKNYQHRGQVFVDCAKGLGAI